MQRLQSDWTFRAAFLIVWSLWLGWLLQFPVALTTDDALNLARGVTHYSVLEFAPHFPGYPAFIWLARLLNSGLQDPAAAVQLAALLGTAVLPWLVIALLQQAGTTRLIAISGGLLTLACPLTISLALSGLTDGPALAAMLAAAWTLGRNQPMLSGSFMGLMLALRPSYLIAALALTGFAHLRRQPLWPLLWPVLLWGAACGLFVLAHDGLAYFEEAWRFSQGHFTLWGNTLVADQAQAQNWFDALNEFLSPLWLVGLMPLARGLVRQPLLATLLACNALWTVLAQNPDNSRHLGLMLYPALPLVLLGLPHYSGRVLGAGALLLAILAYRPPTPPPLHQAFTVIAERCPVLVTHRAVNLARLRLDIPVHDAWYGAEAKLALRQGACRLSSTPRSGHAIAHINSRVRTERSYWLYQPALTSLTSRNTP